MREPGSRNTAVSQEPEPDAGILDCREGRAQFGGLVRHASNKAEGDIAIVAHGGTQEARVAVAVFVVDGDPRERAAELVMVGVWARQRDKTR